MAELRWAIEAHSVDRLGHHLLIAISQEVAIKAVISNSYRITTVTNEFDERIRHLYSLNCSPTVRG